MKLVNRLKRFKISTIPLILVFILIISLAFNGCKGFGIPDWQLEIVFEEGVDGTPIPGVYTYEELTTVSYSYFPTNSEQTVEVLINDIRWPAAGDLIMYNNIKLVVRLFDIRGTWEFTLDDNDSSDELEFSITFFGDTRLAGEFTDTQGYSGTWNIESNILTITYSDWLNYVLTGSINNMEGDWTGDGKTGTWRAVR